MGTQVVEKTHNIGGTPTNGDLSPARQHAVEQGLALYHQVAEERDALLKEVGKLRSDIAGYRVAIDAKDAIMADLESRIVTMQMVRDEAVAHKIKWEVFFAGLWAQMRAYQVPAAPLIVASEEEHDQMPG